MVYEVRVRAANDEGTSGWSDPGEGMTVTPLTVVMASGAEPPVSGPFRVRFSFSEPVTGLTGSDIETGQDRPAWTIRTTWSLRPGDRRTADDRRPGLHHYGNAADRPSRPQLHLDAYGSGRPCEVVGGQ